MSGKSEQVIVRAADGRIIRDFTYNDRHPWPEAADGLGYSLVLIAPQQNPAHTAPANWRASVAVNGNPTSSDAIPFVGDPLGDDNMNGLSNLQEYGLGGTSRPGIAFRDGDTLFTFSRNLAADDVVTLNRLYCGNLHDCSRRPIDPEYRPLLWHS